MKLLGTSLLILTFWLAAIDATAVTSVFSPGKLQPLKGAVAAGDFILKDLNGKPARFRDFQGQVVLLSFWAAWCPGCLKEVRTIEDLYQVYREQGLVVIAVSLDTTPANEMRAIIEKLKLTFPVLQDRDGLVGRLYSIPGVPTSYLIDTQGKIVYRVVGKYDWSDQEARIAVEKLLP